MRLDLLDYELPDELIARHPPEARDGARLLVTPPAPGELHDRTIRHLPELVPRGALVVVNDTRVLPARLLGRKRDSGGRVELLLVRRVSGEPDDRAEVWQALGRASKGLRPGTRVQLGEGGELDGTILDAEGDAGERGLFAVELRAHDGGAVAAAIESVGHVPLPPYMGRPDELSDRSRYQTIYARVPGAVAAPTAGLHLTDEILAALRARDVVIAAATLHVGLGTFQPVTADDLDAHPMHAEEVVVDDALASAVADARRRGAPVVAIGTTAVRALESAANPDEPGYVRPLRGETRLLIQPGYAWKVVDAMLTNFHLPRSTLLALVASFVGLDRALEAYRVAVSRRYRFFSYGDAMYLPRRAGTHPA